MEEQEADISRSLYSGGEIHCSLWCHSGGSLVKTAHLRVEIQTNQPTVIYEDNQSAIALAQNAQFHKRMKHIDRRQHFAREKVSDRVIETKYCRSDCMLADMLTKGLSGTVFETVRKTAGIVPIPTCFSE